MGGNCTYKIGEHFFFCFEWLEEEEILEELFEGLMLKMCRTLPGAVRYCMCDVCVYCLLLVDADDEEEEEEEAKDRDQ